METFVVQHIHIMKDGEEDVKLIGIYSSAESAQNAVNRSLTLPGFKDSPDGFSIDKYIVDEDNWTEGYITSK